MNSLRFVSIVRALALVGSGALVGCTSAAPPSDAAANDVRSMADSREIDVTEIDVTAPDVSERDVTAQDVTVADVRVPDDRPTPTDTGVVDTAVPDVMVADTGVDPCSPFPMDGARCNAAGARCSVMSSDGSFTQCSCDASGSWMCFTAVPGPLPPPELSA